MTTTFPIVEKLGGKTKTALAMTEAGYPIKYRAVQTWHETKRIPSHRVDHLLEAASMKDVAAEWADCKPVTS